MLDDYAAALAGAPIAPESRRTYLSKVRQYLAWLADAAVDGDPLTTPAARDWAVRDYRTHLQAVAKCAPRTVNNALAAVDDFYTAWDSYSYGQGQSRPRTPIATASRKVVAPDRVGLEPELRHPCVLARSYVGLAGFIVLTWDFMVWRGWLVST